MEVRKSVLTVHGIDFEPIVNFGTIFDSNSHRSGCGRCIGSWLGDLGSALRVFDHQVYGSIVFSVGEA